MRSAATVLDELGKLGRIRTDIYADVAVVDSDIGKVLDEAKDHPEISMSEAAKVAGLGRPMAYKLIRKSSRPDVE